MQKSILILKGAGFPEGISTWSITKKVRERDVNGIKINGLQPGEFFYRRLAEFYTQEKGCTECDLNLVNFETIIHFLEELYSFYTSKTKGKAVKNPDFKGIKPAMFWVKKKQLADELVKAKKDSKLKISQFIKEIYYNLIDEVIKQIEPYQSKKNNLRIEEFDKFIRDNLPEVDWIKRIYTLNYDTVVNRKMGYFDGFDNDGNLLSDTILKDDKINCHYNLHGSILWKTNISQNRVSKTKEAINVLNSGVSSSYDISREPLISTPIISGYNKSARMKFNPFLQFYYSLQKDIINADLILIIGYGFNDTHINNLFELAKAKSIIVTYFANWVNDISNLETRTWDDDIVNYLKFKVPLNGGGYPEADGLIKKDWIESKNENVRIWWRGIGNEFYQNWKQMIEK